MDGWMGFIGKTRAPKKRAATSISISIVDLSDGYQLFSLKKKNPISFFQKAKTVGFVLFAHFLT
jgi:hypothetical protein